MTRALPRVLAFAFFVFSLASALHSAAQTSSPAESATVSPPAVIEPQPLQLKDGTPVRLRTTEKISSHDAKAGDKITLIVAADVAVGDLVVIRRGASGLGRVASSQNNRSMGRPGELDIEITSVESLLGQSVPLRASEKIRAQGRNGDPGNALQDRTGPPAGFTLADPIFSKGDNAEVPADTTFTAYVNGDVTLEESKLREVQKPWQLKDGTAVRLRTVEKISSRKAKPGDKIDLRVAGDVVVGNLVVIRQGASALGHVASAQKSGSFSRGGKLAIELTSVETLTGQTVPVRASQKIRGQGYQDELVGNILDLGAQTYGVGLIAAPLFFLVKGDNAEIPPDTTLTAYVNGDLALEPSKLRELQPPPKPTTGPATVYLYRYDVPRGSTPPVYCGAVLISKLRGKHHLQVRIPPGEYLFQSTDPKHTVKLKAYPGQTYYINLTLAWSFRMPGQLELVDPDKGENALAFRWWIVDPAVDLTTADPAKLADTSPPPKPKEEAPNEESPGGPPAN
jgi:hypothetical protein